MVKHYIFGKFEDDKKEKTLSFRVSHETHDLFEKHANTKFGNTSNALKEIFLNYLSNYAFRRQTLNAYIRIFVPRIVDDVIPKDNLPIDNPNPFFSEEVYEDLLDLNSVIVSPMHIQDVKNMDLSLPHVKDEYDELNGWLIKESNYNIEDGFFVTLPLNNHLDKNMDGIYHVEGLDDSQHCGLNIVNYEGCFYYILYFFEVIDVESFYPLHIQHMFLIPNEEAFKSAIGSDNIELCKLIDSFHEGTSNIDDNKQLMLEKRENLLHQIEEIDDILSKFED